MTADGQDKRNKASDHASAVREQLERGQRRGLQPNATGSLKRDVTSCRRKDNRYKGFMSKIQMKGSANRQRDKSECGTNEAMVFKEEIDIR
jgi:hypothetical protein